MSDLLEERDYENHIGREVNTVADEPTTDAPIDDASKEAPKADAPESNGAEGDKKQPSDE